MPSSTQDRGPSDEAADGTQALPSSLFGLDGPFADFLRSPDPFKLFQQNMELGRKLFDIAMGSSKIAPDPRDWRFQDEAWTKNPFYRRLSQA
jgi:hypothetical protein